MTSTILLNPVLIAVIVMLVLCLLKVNVMISLLISAIIAGLVAGMGIVDTMSTIISGMSSKNNVALSYVLLGALAVAINHTGIVKILCIKLMNVFGNKRKMTVLIIAAVASLSQNLIPVHIAFIPILIPPLLHVFNKMKLDRRAVACALVFGLKAPYIVVPVGFGSMFGGIVADNMALAGIEVAGNDIWRYLLIPVLGMVVGLLVAIFITYRKPRVYEDFQVEIQNENENEECLRMTGKHWLTLIAIIIAFGIQVIMRILFDTGLGLHLGALVALVFMVMTGVIPFKQMDHTVAEGVKMMANISFIMLTAGGFAGVVRASGGVDELIEAILGSGGNDMSQLVLAIAMMAIGLIITMGIGTSFGTVPIITAIFVPIAQAGGFSTAAMVCLIGTASVIGDAGSPASDSTLGTTAGLEGDGQHNHIYDTCIPSFLHFDIPLIIFGIVGAVFFL